METMESAVFHVGIGMVEVCHFVVDIPWRLMVFFDHLDGDGS